MKIIIPVIQDDDKLDSDNCCYHRYETKSIEIRYGHLYLSDEELSDIELKNIFFKKVESDEKSKGIKDKYEAIGKKYGPIDIYNYLDEGEIYANLLMLLFDLLKVEYDEVRNNYNDARKEMSTSDYSKCAPKINKLQRDLTSMKSYISESIAIMDENIRECKGANKTITKYFIESKNVLKTYEESVETYLQEVLTYSDIEIMKNNHHMSEVIEMFSAITIVGLIPTIIFSFYGINIGAEGLFKNSNWAIMISVTVALICVALFILYRFGYLIPKKIEEKPDSDKIKNKQCKKWKKNKLYLKEEPVKEEKPEPEAEPVEEKPAEEEKKEQPAEEEKAAE